MSTRTKKNIAGRNFLDIEIHIYPCRDDAYPVEITLDNGEEFAGCLSANVCARSPSGDHAKDGQKLFDTLFEDKNPHAAWHQAKSRSSQRRIRLRIDAPELHSLPWELLREGNITLSAGDDTPFSRYLAVPEQWGDAVSERPIRVLALVSNPADLEQTYHLSVVNVNEERGILERAFATLNKFEIQLDFLDPPVTLTRIAQYLQDVSGCHVLHYVGHGAFSERRGEAALYLQGEDHNTDVVEGIRFVEMLARQSQRARPRLIFLAACQTAIPSTAAVFQGLGPCLVEAGVPAVVAMQDRIAVETARELTHTFYRRLIQHGTVDLALNQARSILLAAERTDAAVPVLFMRLKSGQLWEAGERGLSPTTPSMDAPDTVLIPAGPFWMGSDSDDAEAHDNEKPRRRLDLPEYQIGRYPVTNAQYTRFISDTGHNPPDHWDGRNVPAGLEDHPVVNVSFEDAVAYCHWLSQVAGQHYRLPTEAEWEKAARGGLPETRRYPWGDKWQPDSCNTCEVGRNGATPVHEFEHVNRSPFGVTDMVGNVWEWTASWYERYPDSSHESVHYGRVYRVVRGGSWRSDCQDVHISCRGRYKPDERRPYVGFRVASVVTVP
jgi:formylglycine-generating enzyme required for sulfatase activity